jgi:hypothetical protein
MLHARIVLAALLATAFACASKKAADTAPSAEPKSEPAQPAVDLAIFDENKKDFEEINAILPEFEKVAKAAAEGPTEFQKAVTAVSDLGRERGVKEKRVDRIVADSLKAKKVKLRGVKRADREEMTAAVQAMIDAVGGLEASAQTISDTRIKIAELQGNIDEIAKRIRERTEEVASGPESEAQKTAQAQIEHVGKVLAAVKGNVDASHGLLDDLEKNAKALADALGVKIKEAEAVSAPPAEKKEGE